MQVSVHHGGVVAEVAEVDLQLTCDCDRPMPPTGAPYADRQVAAPLSFEQGE